jgi:hypothetical protein
MPLERRRERKGVSRAGRNELLPLRIGTFSPVVYLSV